MTELLYDMLYYILINEVGISNGKSKALAAQFADIEEFMDTDIDKLKKIKSIGGKKFLKLDSNDIDKIEEFRKKEYLSKEISEKENFLRAMGRDFTRKQLKMLKNLELDNLNPNPLLINALNLHNPQEVVSLYVYAVATRSIVTSMGYFVERLLLSSSELVENPSKGWDILKIDDEGNNHWIQVKSGPNDMDKDQIVYWANEISKKIKEGDNAYIGITYGNKSQNTVTFNLMRQSLPDWEIRTLVGRELWDFISDDPDYHSKVLTALRNAAWIVLSGESISEEIELCIKRIKEEFLKRYGDGLQGVNNYLYAIF